MRRNVNKLGANSVQDLRAKKDLRAIQSYSTSRDLQASSLCLGTICFLLMSPRWRCLIVMHSAMFGENQKQRITTNTLYQLSSMGCRGVMIWVCFIAQDLANLQPLMNSRKYTSKSTSDILLLPEVDC